LFGFSTGGLATLKLFRDAMTKLGKKTKDANAPSVLSSTLRRLQLAFARADARFFWCNTDRGAGPGGNELEKRMHKRGFAATWVAFDYEAHMRRVRRGDLILMYANEVGVIAVGRVKESKVEILGPDHPDRLREHEYDEHDEEWRIRVKWLVWDESAPCQISKPLRKSFLEMQGDGGRLRNIRRHFLREEVPAEGAVRRTSS
jgi:hypothetical protein